MLLINRRDEKPSNKTTSSYDIIKNSIKRMIDYKETSYIQIDNEYQFRMLMEFFDSLSIKWHGGEFAGEANYNDLFTDKEDLIEGKKLEVIAIYKYDPLIKRIKEWVNEEDFCLAYIIDFPEEINRPFYYKFVINSPDYWEKASHYKDF